MPVKNEKKVKKQKAIFLFIVYLFIVFYAFHYTHVKDTYEGTLGPKGIHFNTQSSTYFSVNEMSVGGIAGLATGANGNTLTYLAEGALEMVTRPFSLSGLVIFHSLRFLAIISIIYFLFLLYELTDQKLHKKDAAGIENGSAKWYDDWDKWKKDMEAPYGKQEQSLGLPDRNILIAKNLKLSMNVKKTQRNLSVLIIGGAGTGKSFKWIKPNLAQMNSSYVVTDPSGEIMECMGKMLMQNGYSVRLFSTSDPRHSDCYNPLDYIYDTNGDPDETKIAGLVNTFIKNAANTGGGGKKGGDPFWEKSSNAFLMFAILYLVEFEPMEKRNFATILSLAQMGKADEDSSSSETALDKLVNRASSLNPKAKCLNNYKTFSLAPAKTRNSILISVAVDLNVFSIDDIRAMTSTSYLCKRNNKGQIKEYRRDKSRKDVNNPDGYPIRDSKNINLDKVANEKTALFINIKQAGDALTFLIAMMYSQLFDMLYTVGEKISPKSYHIHASNGMPLSTMYSSSKVANQALELYKNATVIAEGPEGAETYYIYNKDAGKEFTIIDKAAEGKKNYGYLKKVYSKEVGEKLISQYQSASVKRGRIQLPNNVQFLLDEFANIGQIPNFPQLLATMRKYGLSCCIVLQSLAQIKSMYDKEWETLVANCDSLVFLGTSEYDTCKYISDKLGNATIKDVGVSQSKGKSGSVSENFTHHARKLMEPDEVSKLNNEKCICFVRGLDPFLVKKMNFAEHSNFHMTGDFDDNNKMSEDDMDFYFTCETKDIAEKVEEEEKRAKQINADKETDKYGHPTKYKAKKTATRQKFAEEVGLTDETIEKGGKDIRSVSKEDRQDGTDPIAVKKEDAIPGIPEYQDDFVKENSSPAPDSDEENNQSDDGQDNGNVGFVQAQSITPNGPEAEGNNDDSWMYF